MPLQSTRVRWLRIVVLAVAGIGLLGGSVVASDAPAGVAAAQDGEEPLVESCADEMPADYEDPPGGTAETIGWVDGYWYDEPIDADASDGLSEAELERLTARTAARVEALRCLTFEDGVPPVEVVTREELGNRTGQQFANVSTDARRFDNAVLSTTLFVGESNDSVDTREDSRTQTVAGYYDIEGDRIVVVEREGAPAGVDETVLTHEVAHALQDQQFGIERPSNVTSDRDSGLLGLVEGDASWIEYRYLDRCEANRWDQPCVTLDDGGDGTGDGEGGDGGSSAPPNWGLYLQQYQPYSDGPSFVRSIHDDGGWAAVNDVYDDPPESALYTVFPDTYGEVALAEPAIEDRDRGGWERIELADAPDYERVGPAGIGAMVIAPTYETDGLQGVVQPREFLNYDADDNLSQFDPLDYGQPPVEGWRGGRLAVFERGNDTATVWRTAWTGGANATEFADAYEQLLEIHDVEPVDGRDGVYRFTADSEHAGAAAVLVEGDSVRIVTAPSVDALDAVSPPVAASDGEAGIADALPGFGLVAGLLATLLLALGLATRRGLGRGP